MDHGYVSTAKTLDFSLAGLASSRASSLPHFEMRSLVGASLLAKGPEYSKHISNGQKTPGATQVAPGVFCQPAVDVVDPPPAVELDV
ncbi:hypothetical protein EMIT0347P_20520 [Pseudomonas sp. IT-347P]